MHLKKCKEAFPTPCLIENPPDLLYLTGLTLSKGRLLLSKDQAILFVDGRYFEVAKKKAPCEVRLWEEQKQFANQEIGFDSTFVTYDGYLSLQKTFPKLKPVPNPLRALRAIKTPEEVACLRKAAKLTWDGYRHVLTLLKEGISEEALAFEFEMFCRKNGASAMSFSPIIAFGENSAYPHHRAGKTTLKKDQVVLIDVGAVVDDYAGDMTRIAYFGTPDPKIKRFEEIVRKAQRKAIEHVKPGIALGELDQIVCDEFEKANVKPLYIHSLGHGIGLETHEYPRVKVDGEDKNVIAKAGMVFTIEPGLYEAGVGGIRIEDMILVTPSGYENLFPDARA
jgi:Xaa-Pro aminopeptidase